MLPWSRHVCLLTSLPPLGATEPRGVSLSLDVRSSVSKAVYPSSDPHSWSRSRQGPSILCCKSRWWWVWACSPLSVVPAGGRCQQSGRRCSRSLKGPEEQLIIRCQLFSFSEILAPLLVHWANFALHCVAPLIQQSFAGEGESRSPPTAVTA